MSSEALNAVFENIAELSKAARSLYKQKRFNLSVHVAIAAREEMSKYLMLFCKEHLPLNVFKKRFSHVPKHRLAMAPYYINGQLSLAYILEKGAEMLEGAPIGIQTSQLSTYLQNALLRGNPAWTTNAILHSLRKSDDEVLEAATSASAAKVEAHRTSSIYVDISESSAIVSRPSDITATDARGYLEDVAVGLATITFMRTPTMSLSEYFILLPAKKRRVIEREIAARVRDFVELFSQPRTKQFLG
jgi:AbiV family abortive infection protein